MEQAVSATDREPFKKRFGIFTKTKGWTKPLQKLLYKLTRPISKPLLGIPLPSDEAMESIEGLFRQLEKINSLLTDQETTSVRIVVNPEKMVIKEAERSFMYLNLYGFNTDAVIVNRLLPTENLVNYFRKWSEAQSSYFEYVQDQFNPVPVFRVPLFQEEVFGFDGLSKMAAECFGPELPDTFFYRGQIQRISAVEDGFRMELKLPFAQKGDVSLSQKGEELTIRIGDYKRNIILPRKLLGREAVGAKMETDLLIIRFGEVVNVR